MTLAIQPRIYSANFSQNPAYKSKTNCSEISFAGINVAKAKYKAIWSARMVGAGFHYTTCPLWIYFGLAGEHSRICEWFCNTFHCHPHWVGAAACAWGVSDLAKGLACQFAGRKGSLTYLKQKGTHVGKAIIGFAEKIKPKKTPKAPQVESTSVLAKEVKTS